MWIWDPISGRYIWHGPLTQWGAPATDTLPPDSPPGSLVGVGGAGVGGTGVGGTRNSGNDPHPVDPNLFLNTSDPLGGLDIPPDIAWWILTHPPKDPRPDERPLDKNKANPPWTGFHPDNTTSCPPTYNANPDDPCCQGALGKTNREKIKKAWGDMRTNLQNNHGILDTMKGSSGCPAMAKFAKCLEEKGAGLKDNPSDPWDPLTFDPSIPPNLDIGCDDANLHSEGVMGHTDSNKSNGRTEITLNMAAIDNAAKLFGCKQDDALQSVILHELSHACEGSELDSRLIENLFYPNLNGFNEIRNNKNRDTLGKICEENKYQGSGSIIQGKIFQWDYKTGNIMCVDDSGDSADNVSDNIDHSMGNQADDKYYNDYFKKCP